MKKSLSQLIIAFVLFIIVCISLIITIANIKHENTIIFLFGTIALSIIIGLLLAIPSDTPIRRFIVYLSIILMFSAIVIGASIPKEIFEKSIQVDLYFDLDNQGFLIYSTKEQMHPSSMHSITQLHTMTDLLRSRIELREALRLYVNPDYFVGKPDTVFFENQQIVFELFRDFGEILMLNSISADYIKAEDYGLFQHELNYIAAPPTSIRSENPLRLNDFYTSDTQSVFLSEDIKFEAGIRDVTIYVPKDFVNMDLTRDEDRYSSSVELKKYLLKVFPIFTVTLLMDGPQFGHTGTGQLPRWIEAKNRHHIWTQVTYRFTLKAESHRPLTGFHQIPDYIEWTKDLWRSITLHFGWTQISDEHRFQLEYINKKIESLEKK